MLTFHAQLLLTNISNGITVPVHYCNTLFQAGGTPLVGRPAQVGSERHTTRDQ